MASFEDNFRELKRLFEKWSAKFDSQLLASSSQGSDSPGIRSKVGYDDRTLLVRIHLEDYSISWDVLNQVFSKIGYLEYIEVFAPDSQFHSQVRFQDRESAVKAVERYDGLCIYDGCCLMELALEVSTSHPSSTIVAPLEDSTPEIVTSKIEHVQEESFVDEYKLFDEMPMEDEPEILQDNCIVHLTSASGEVEELQELRPTPFRRMQDGLNKQLLQFDQLESIVERQPQIQHEDYTLPCCQIGLSLQVPIIGQLSKIGAPIENSTLVIVPSEVVPDIDDGFAKVLSSSLTQIGIEETLKKSLTEFLVTFPAHKVFVNMLEKLRVVVVDFIELPSTLGEVFQSIASFRSFIFDRGKGFVFPLHLESSIDDFIGVINTLGDAFGSVQSRSFPFDPGKYFELSFHTTSCAVCCGFFVEFVLQTGAGSGGCCTLTVVPENTSSAAKFCGVYCCKFRDGIAEFSSPDVGCTMVDCIIQWLNFCVLWLLK